MPVCTGQGFEPGVSEALRTSASFPLLPMFPHLFTVDTGFPGDSVVKNPPAEWEMWVRFLGWEDPLEREMGTHSSIPGRSHGQRREAGWTKAGYSPWGHKESDML